MEQLPKRAYSVAEAAGLLGVSENTLRAEIRDGNIFVKQVRGRRLLVPSWAIDEYLARPEPSDTWDKLLLRDKGNGKS